MGLDISDALRNINDTHMTRGVTVILTDLDRQLDLLFGPSGSNLICYIVEQFWDISVGLGSLCSVCEDILPVGASEMAELL